MNLMIVEMSRALQRRAIRVLIALGVAGCVIAGIVAYVSSSGKTIAEIQEHGQSTHPSVMTDWWVSGGGDGILSIGFFFLLLGGLFGGATVAGAEWRYGTITAALTWEPRRMALHGARAASAVILAFVIALLLQGLFLSAFMPAAVMNGTTSGADSAWWLGLGAAMVRISFLTAMSALLGLSLATLGRNTAFGLVAVFAWMAVIENLIRGLVPSVQPWLWGENLSIILTWAQLSGESFVRAPALSLATVAGYVAVISLGAASSFQHRDIAAAT